MGLLLVEPAIAENSVETNNLDPSTLVTTPAKIKELIKAKIDEVAPGNLPDYKFNKQLSSAYITNLDGNKVLEDGFSYIAKAGDYLFLAKNTPDTDVKVFSIPENKIVEEKKAEVAPVVENTEVVIPSLDTTKVEESAPTDLSNVFEDTSTVDESANNLSFEEITSETPTNEVGGETPMANTMSEADFDAALASLDNDKQDMITAMQDGKSFIDQQATETSYDEYDPLADYQGFHEDKLEYDTNFNNDDYSVDGNLEIVSNDMDYTADTDSDYKLDDSLEIVPDTTARDVIQTIKKLKEENVSQARELAESKAEGKKKDDIIRIKDQKLTVAGGAIHDLKDTVIKSKALIADLEKKLAEGQHTKDVLKSNLDDQKYTNAQLRKENEALKKQLEDYNYLKTEWSMLNSTNEYEDKSYIKYQ